MRTGTPSRRAAHRDACTAQSPTTSSTCFGFSQSRPWFAARSRLLAAGLEQGMASERRVPDRRNAGLAIGLVARRSTSSLSIDSRATTTRRIVGRIAEHVVHHHGSWPSPDRSRRGRPRRSAARRRTRRALVDRAAAQLSRKQRLDRSQHACRGRGRSEPAPAF